ncbi:hypothetical protein T08_8863 [Trichinella sp. T8]|nr:hypothetical protein T08_14161 [Trichinella sp. T8]KRZ81908.1 hypothetical protein T08_8863 [Trichinella sp. T8]
MLIRAEYPAFKNRWQPVASWSPSQNGQTRWTDVTNANAEDATQSRPFLSALVNSFRVASPPFSSLDASGLNSSGGDSESACSWANSRNFFKLSSDSGPDLTFKSQALCSSRGNFSFSPGIRASLHGSSPAWWSLPIAARHLRSGCLVASSRGTPGPSTRPGGEREPQSSADQNAYARCPPPAGELRGVVQLGVRVDAGLKLRPKRGEFQYFPIELREREFRQFSNSGWGGSLSKVAAVAAFAARRSIQLLRLQPALGSCPGFQKTPPALSPVFNCGFPLSGLQVLLPFRLKGIRLTEERFRQLQLATQQVVIHRVDTKLFQFRQETVQSDLVSGELPGPCLCCCGHSSQVLRISVGRCMS